MRRRACIALVALLSVGVASRCEAQTFHYTDLGAYYYPASINPVLAVGSTTQYVAGTYESTSTYPFFSILASGSWGSPVQITGASYSSGYGTGVNDSGNMTGYMTTVTMGTPNTDQGFTFDISTGSPVGGMWSGTICTSGQNLLKFAYGINNAGNICGWDDQANYGFFLDPDETQMPSTYNNIIGGTIPTASTVLAVNNAATPVYAGVFSPNANRYSGYFTSGGKWNPIPYGTMPQTYLNGSAAAINSNAVVAGFATNTASSTQNAYTYDTVGGTLSFLGVSTDVSTAYGINDGNSVVGSMYVSTDVFYHAFLAYHGSTTLTDLNGAISGLPAHTTLVQATAINNDANGSTYTHSGYIVGYSMVQTTVGKISTWIPHGFVLTPI